MKRFNYIYYAILILIGLGIFVYTERYEEEVWMVPVVIFYSIWISSSHFLFYAIHKKKLKKKFQNLPQLKGEFTTFWMDTREQKVALLCMFNPFRVQSIAFDKIEDMSIYVDYVKGNNKLAYVIYLVMVIAGKKYRMQIHRRASHDFIDMEGRGKQVVNQGEAFIHMYKNSNVNA